MQSSLDACLVAGKARGVLNEARRFAPAFILFLVAAACPVPAAAQKVRITNLSDVDFGLVSNLQSDALRSQNVCLYSNGAGGLYSVTASGSGAGSAFALSNGASTLSYEVQWSSQSGQAAGTSLTPNVAVTGQSSAATHQFCNSGPAASASLIVILRSSALSQAREGLYSGSLSLLIAAE